MDEFSNINESAQQDPFTAGEYPAKPELQEKSKNSWSRSAISLLIYMVLFYVLFDQNIAYIAAITVVVIIHEMGHLLAMKIFNYSNVKIFFIPLIGAFTSGKKQEVSQKQLSIIILAGPLPGLIVACILYFLNKDINSDTMKMLANCFLFINLFNLLPIYPLDGGRIIETLFFKQNYYIRLVFGIISIILLAVLFATASTIMIIVPIFMGIELFNESKNQKIRNILKSENINYHKAYNALTNKEYWLIRDCILFAYPKKFAGLQPGVYQYTIIEPLIIQQVNTILQINMSNDLSMFMRILFLLLYIASFAVPLVLFGLHI
ncbi:MAG: site-2 protease family protein [Sphingobacteriaceae bacterium]|nr:site-2 protease family protein [Sphingobacteriaceae bacterium]